MLKFDSNNKPILLSIISFLLFTIMSLILVLSFEPNDNVYNILGLLIIPLAVWPYAYWIGIPTLLVRDKFENVRFFQIYVILSLMTFCFIVSATIMQHLVDVSAINRNWFEVGEILGFIGFISYILLLINTSFALKLYTKNIKYPSSVFGVIVSLFYLPIGMFFIHKKILLAQTK